MLKFMIRNALSMRGAVMLLGAAIIAFGAYSYFTMPRDAFPDISPVMVPIFAEAPGMAPEELERTVTSPIESAMSGLPSVTLLKSTSGFGMGVIYVYFADNVNIYFARQLVAERLNSVMAQLPPEMPKPELGPISSGLGQIFIYYLKAAPGIDTHGKELDAYLRELNDFVVKRQLQTVPGVTAILSMGGHVLQYRINLDPDAMARYGVTLDDVVKAVKENNRAVGGQYVVMGAEEYLVRGIGLLKSLEDLGNVPVHTADGAPLLLSRIAKIEYGNEIRRGVVSRNGAGEVVAGMVLKLYGENTSRVIAALHEKIDAIKLGLPKGVEIVPYYDQADLVNNASKTVETALLQGIILVVLVLAITLWNFRAALIVALSMPFCAAFAMICMHMFDISANLMSLGGIAIALGMLVDGSIVVVENIMRHLGMPGNAQRKKITVVREATIEVGRPICFALLIIIAVFIPVFMLDGVEGKMFKPLAFSVVAALGGSIISALLLAPVLSSALLRQGRLARRPAEEFCDRIVEKCYLPLLSRAVKLRYPFFALLAVALGGSVWLLAATGREFMPTLEEGAIVITVNMAPSIGLERAVQVVGNLEKIILQHKEVTGTVARIGRPEAGSHPHPVNFAEIQLSLQAPDGGLAGAAVRQRIVGELRRELGHYPGVTLNFSQPIQNAFDELLSGIRTYFAIKLYGENSDVLRAKAEEIRQAVSGIPGVVDLATEQSYGQPQIQIELNRAKAARYGVPGSEVMTLIESAVGGAVIDGIYQNARRYDIALRLDEKYRATPEAIGSLRLRAADGKVLELKEIADIKITEGPIQINREKNQRRWIVQGNIAGRAPSEIIGDMRRAIREKVKLPAGYFVEFGGQFENQERAMNRLLIIVPLVIALIFVLLCFTFGSFREAILVMVNVPLALIGGVVGLTLTGQLLSLPAAIGFISLFGIAMQDAVVLVTDFRDLRRSGMGLDEALRRGCAMRFRAVILTTLTTLLGLLPLLLSHGIGAEIQKPLAAIVVFGLSSSTLLTLFFLPVLYRTFCKKSEV